MLRFRLTLVGLGATLCHCSHHLRQLLLRQHVQQCMQVGVSRGKVLLDVDVTRASVAPNVEGVEVQCKLMRFVLCLLAMQVHVTCERAEHTIVTHQYTRTWQRSKRAIALTGGLTHQPHIARNICENKSGTSNLRALAQPTQDKSPVNHRLGSNDAWICLPLTNFLTSSPSSSLSRTRACRARLLCFASSTIFAHSQHCDLSWKNYKHCCHAVVNQGTGQTDGCKDSAGRTSRAVGGLDGT